MATTFINMDVGPNEVENGFSRYAELYIYDQVVGPSKPRVRLKFDVELTKISYIMDCSVLFLFNFR